MKFILLLLSLLTISSFAFASEDEINIVSCDTENGGIVKVYEKYNTIYIQYADEANGGFWDNSNAKVSLENKRNSYLIKYKFSAFMLGSEKLTIEINKDSKKGILKDIAKCGLVALPFCSQRSESFEVKLLNCEVEID